MKKEKNAFNIISLLIGVLGITIASIQLLKSDETQSVEIKNEEPVEVRITDQGSLNTNDVLMTHSKITGWLKNNLNAEKCKCSNNKENEPHSYATTINTSDIYFERLNPKETMVLEDRIYAIKIIDFTQSLHIFGDRGFAKSFEFLSFNPTLKTGTLLMDFAFKKNDNIGEYSFYPIESFKEEIFNFSFTPDFNTLLITNGSNNLALRCISEVDFEQNWHSRQKYFIDSNGYYHKAQFYKNNSKSGEKYIPKK